MSQITTHVWTRLFSSGVIWLKLLWYMMESFPFMDHTKLKGVFHLFHSFPPTPIHITTEERSAEQEWLSEWSYVNSFWSEIWCLMYLTYKRTHKKVNLLHSIINLDEVPISATSWKKKLGFLMDLLPQLSTQTSATQLPILLFHFIIEQVISSYFDSQLSKRSFTFCVSVNNTTFKKFWTLG